MNTTDKIMALADKYVSYVRGSDLSVDAREALRAEIESLVRDAERLNWMIFHSAKVRHSSDGEFCTVTWYDDEGQVHETKPFGSARQAIAAAIQEKQS